MLCEICSSKKDAIYCRECSWNKVAFTVLTLRNLVELKSRFIQNISVKLQNRRTDADRITELKSKISHYEKNIAHSEVYLDKRLIREIKRSLRYHQENAQNAITGPRKSHCENDLPSKLQQIQAYRKQHLECLATSLEINPYFPEYSIGELFNIDKCIKYVQIFKDQDEIKAVDKPSYVISFKSKLHSAQIGSQLTDEHRHALVHSVNILGHFLCYSSQLLNIHLPFPLSFNLHHFEIIDLQGNKHSLNIDDTYNYETALVFLYQDMKYLSQTSGVDFNNVRGLFDVMSLVRSPYVGRCVSEPSDPPLKSGLRSSSMSLAIPSRNSSSNLDSYALHASMFMPSIPREIDESGEEWEILSESSDI